MSAPSTRETCGGGQGDGEKQLPASVNQVHAQSIEFHSRSTDERMEMQRPRILYMK
jgi:hypothetical protein